LLHWLSVVFQILRSPFTYLCKWVRFSRELARS